ncbi:MAG: penicillin-binding protein 2 [Actinobacteria bacterium]|nr:penicillin-binding protein 2 [Actinomycetota bacterium]
MSDRNRYLGIGTVLALLFTIAVGKLTDVQVLSPGRYRSTGVTQRTVRVALPAGRGAILDRNGEDLALSVPRSTVVADPVTVTDVAAEASRLADILNIDRATIEPLLRKRSRFVYIDRLIPDSAASAVKKLMTAGKLPGIDLIDEYQRVRPNGSEAGSVVGMTDIDGQGISGLEKQYQGLLKGIPGEVSYETSAMGPIPGGQRQLEAARPGDDLQLTIDLPLQYSVEKLVADQVTATGSESGIAIITRPSTGEILSMVNVATDPKTHKATPSTNNEALTTVFEPGSVNKVITVATALQDHKVDPSTVFEHPPTMTLGGATFGEAESLPSRLSVTDILTVSSNIGTIKIAQMLGPQRIDRALRDFGLGSPTGLGFPNESPGLLLPLANWSGSSIGSIPIGQGISVTALQMLDAYNVLANGGVAVAPKLVSATIDASGRRQPTPASRGHRVIPADVARELRGILANVVKTGTGQKAAVPGYQVAGKTGTARKPLAQHQPGNGYMGLDGRYHYVSTFVGMLPANDPQLSIIVVLNDPSGSYYASDTAAPLFGAIAAEAVRRLRIPPVAGQDATDGLPAVNPQLLGSLADAPTTETSTRRTGAR